MAAFRPFASGTVNIAATTSSGRVTLPVPVNEESTVLVHNAGTTLAFVEFGPSASVAASTTTSMPIPAGAHRVVQTGKATGAAAIMASSTATIYFTAGTGDN
jgi:hypothetical protein